MVKRLSGHSQSWGPRFDSQPKQTQVGMSVPIDLQEHCWQVMCTTAEMDSHVTKSNWQKHCKLVSLLVSLLMSTKLVHIY